MRSCTTLLLLAMAAGLPAPKAVAQMACHPGGNILLIVADDVGVENIACYGVGHCSPPTPNIDCLARGGVLFRNAWSNPLCSATRAGIHTGRHGFRTGVGLVVWPLLPNMLPHSEVTLPVVLGRHGYATALIGKWHLGNRHNGGRYSPAEAGWSYHAGPMWSGFFPPNDYYRWRRLVNGEVSVCHRYATTQTVDDALAWINNQSGPWICNVAFNAAHDPYHVPPAHLHTYDLRGLSPKKHPVPHYRAAIQAMDTEIGRLLACLGPRLAHTTVIFVGDNGTPGDVIQPPLDKKHGKATVYQGGVNVPLIIHGPLVNRPCREVCAIVNTLDLFSTIVALAGGDARLEVPCDRYLDSVSLVPYMLDPCHPPLRDTVYTEIFWCLDRDRGCAAIRDQRYKLIRKSWIGGPKHEFYDLAEDPLEQHDMLRGDHRMTSEVRSIYQALVDEMETLRASE